MCRIRPPFPFGTCATLDAGGAPKKKDSPPPPPPPPAHQLFWDLRDFRGWRRSEKNSVLCPPPPFFSWIRPCEGGWREWLMYLIKLFQVIHLISIFYKSLSIFLQLHCGIKVVFVKKQRRETHMSPVLSCKSQSQMMKNPK